MKFSNLYGGSVAPVVVKKSTPFLNITSRTNGRFTDVDAARKELAGPGVQVGEVQEFPWGRFVFFTDPDGDRRSVQQVPARS